ncbi:MAG: type II toxin-antitoxin system RatA family toxin [Pseudomonadales bacterium]
MVRRSALLPYPPRAVYDVVSDVPSYPEFLPWCRDARVLERQEHEVVAELELDARGLQERFTTRNRLFPHERIELELVSGPFRSFAGTWRFIGIGGDAGCRVELDLDFQFSGARSMLGSAFSSVFARAADRMVDAFCARVQASRAGPSDG